MTREEYVRFQNLNISNAGIAFVSAVRNHIFPRFNWLRYNKVSAPLTRFPNRYKSEQTVGKNIHLDEYVKIFKVAISLQSRMKKCAK